MVEEEVEKEEVVVVEAEEEVVEIEEEEAAEMEKVEVKVVETGEEISSDRRLSSSEGLSLGDTSLQEEKQGDSYPSISVTFAPAAHTSSHTPPPSARQPVIPTGSRSCWRSLSPLCHVVSLLLCNFLLLFFFLPLFSSFPERMCLLSLRRSVSGGLKQPIFGV